MQSIPIVIVNYKDYARRYLAECVASLRLVRDIPWSLVIIDNASSEETRAYIRETAPEAELIPFEDNAGYAVYSRVVPMLAERGHRYVLIANMDVVFDPDFLSPLVRELDAHQDIIAAQARIMLHGSDALVNSVGNTIHFLGFGYSVGGYQPWKSLAVQYREPRQIPYASGAALLMRTDALSTIGLFDADFFMYHEDLDLGWKILLAGKRSIIVPDAIVHHKYEFARSASQYYWMERNRFVCIFKNYLIPTIILLLPLLLLMELGLLAFAVKRGFLKEKLRVYAQLLRPSFWKRVREGRRHITGIRQARDRDVLMHFTGRIEAQQISNPFVRFIANPLCETWFLLMKLIVWW